MEDAPVEGRENQEFSSDDDEVEFVPAMPELQLRPPAAAAQRGSTRTASTSLPTRRRSTAALPKDGASDEDEEDPAKEGTSDDSSSDEEEEEEGSSDPSSPNDDNTATRKIMQTQLFSMDRKVDAEERQEIGAIMDHLIAEGNYWRHRDWRMAQWRRSTIMTTKRPVSAPASVVAPAASSLAVPDLQDQTSSNSDESIPGESGRQSTASRKRKDPPQQSSTSSSTAAAAAAAAIESEGNNAATSTAAIDDILLHVPDARVYQESYDQGVEPGTWPLPPHRTNRRAKSEKQWDWELSDGLHPVAFSQMRLTRQTHPLPGCCGEEHSMQLPLDYDLDPDQTNCKVSGDDAARAMLLRCWERAVHAAASTMDVLGARPTESPPAAAQPFQHARTRDAAIATCARMQIDPYEEQRNSDDEAEHDGTTTCFVCGIERPSKEEFEDHFYGTATTNGCCWSLIEHRRRALLANALQAEVQNQTQQLMRFVLMESLKNIDGNLARPLDCFDVLKIVVDKYQASKPIHGSSASSGGRDASALAETLEVQLDEPPLHINAFVVDSFRSRVVDRYAKVPR